MSEDTAGERATGQSAPSVGGAKLSLDTALELLADRQRRFALYTFRDDSEGVVSLHDLIEDVATLVAALDEEALTRESYLAVARDLYHWHLPVLADVGVISCDPRTETIRYFPHPTLETWLQRVRDDELD